jgi:hypothetical protein
MVSKGLMGTVTFAMRRGGASQHVVIPAKAGIQYAATSMIEPQRLWNTGSPAFAGDDGCGRGKPGDDDIPKTPPCGPGSKLRDRR